MRPNSSGLTPTWEQLITARVQASTGERPLGLDVSPLLSGKKQDANNASAPAPAK